jgi:hypothetical protein
MARKPRERQCKALRKIQAAETGRPSFVNSGDAETCERLGWVEAQPGGGYCLTEDGRRILRVCPEENDPAAS